MKPVALITGGTRGIGLGIAKALAKNGFDLALNGVRDKSQVIDILNELRELAVDVEYFQGDISLSSDRQKILEGIKQSFGRLNILVNNAGVAPKVRADVLEVSESDYDGLMDINQKGTFFLTQAVCNWMISQKKEFPDSHFAIINITSVSAVLASTNRIAYCMSKAALSMMSRVLAVRMAEENIPVFEVRPGVIETDMTAKVREQYVERIKEGLTLEKRIGQAEDIGNSVATLALGHISYATGQVITIDGGMTVGRL